MHPSNMIPVLDDKDGQFKLGTRYLSSFESY